MSESEQREIETLANYYANGFLGFPIAHKKQGYIAGATAMAEKKNEEIEQWKEAKDKDILYWKQEAELQHSQLSDLRAELERVKAVADKFAVALEYPNLTTHTATSETLASWNKSKSETLNEPKR